MPSRCETFTEMRQVAEKALLHYVKRNNLEIGVVHSVSWFPPEKVHREGVEARMYNHGKKWLLEATLDWENGPHGTVTFDHNKFQIKEL